MLEIRLNTLTDQEWDNFVHGQKHAVWAHMAAWRSVIARVYVFRAYYFEAWQGGVTVGVLPTVNVSSRLFGNHLVSMPYLDDGGVLATDTSTERALMAAAADHAKMIGARCDCRSALPLETDWTVSMKKVTLKMEIGSDAKAIWKSLPSTRRNRIRKARDNGLTVSFHGKEELSGFYEVFCMNMRDLGSPVHKKDFFEAVLRSFPGHTGIILVRDKDNRPAGGGLYVRFGDTMALPWVSCRRDAFHLYPNMLLYWELIQKACQEGAVRFDFGRSSVDSGTYEFKRQWGAEPSPLYWYSRSTGRENPAGTSDADSPLRKVMVQLWKRLPLPVANRLGPRLRRSITL